MTLGTSVYVHFPWCLKKCPYCDFATRKIAQGDIPHREYGDAIKKELARRIRTFDGSRLASIFIGGGTPSLWDLGVLEELIGDIRSSFESEVEHLEVTVECNPSSVGLKKFQGLKQAGVTRFSIGVQSLSDEHLQFLGRLHRADDAKRAVAEAASVLPRVSADLMFGMADHQIDRLLRDIDELLELGLSHVSSYALTIEPGTRFGELHRRGRLTVATEDTYADMFVRATELFRERGLGHYEVSNYAKPGEESVHNAHYWKGGDYLGLGAAAVGCIWGSPGHARRYKNVPDGMKYVLAVEASDDLREVEQESEDLSGEEILQESFMLGLRTREGVNLTRASQRAGQPALLGRENEVERLVNEGLVIASETHVRVPHKNWLGLDSIVARLF